MSEKDIQYSVITLTNSTSKSLDLKVAIDAEEISVVTLEPGHSTSQLSPGGASWTLHDSDGAEVIEPAGSKAFPDPKRSGKATRKKGVKMIDDNELAKPDGTKMIDNTKVDKKAGKKR